MVRRTLDRLDQLAHNEQRMRAVVVVVGFLLLVVLGTNTYQNGRQLEKQREAQLISCQGQFRLISIKGDYSAMGSQCQSLFSEEELRAGGLPKEWGSTP